MKRSIFVLFVLVACSDRGSGGGSAMCQDVSEGAVCTSGLSCVLPNDFSSCESQNCECTGGHYHCQPIEPSDGEPCTNAPIQGCSYEGHPDCSLPPASQLCSCDADGTWHCVCACYGPESTCGFGCPARFIPEMEGASCTAGLSCTYPGKTCQCADDGTGSLRLHCT